MCSSLSAVLAEIESDVGSKETISDGKEKFNAIFAMNAALPTIQPEVYLRCIPTKTGFANNTYLMRVCNGSAIRLYKILKQYNRESLIDKLSNTIVPL